MGAAGSDVAVEAAHIALMKDNWLLVPELFRIAGRTMGVVAQSWIHGIYNVAGITWQPPACSLSPGRGSPVPARPGHSRQLLLPASLEITRVVHHPPGTTNFRFKVSIAVTEGALPPIPLTQNLSNIRPFVVSITIASGKSE
jgi:hypothetical protein